MNDVLGDALQKLASTEPVFPAPLSEPQAEPVLCHDTPAPALASVEPSSSPSEVVITTVLIRSESQTDLEMHPDREPHVAEVPPTLAQRWMKTALRRNPLPIVLAHRRQAAAVVVLVCMAVFWTEESVLTVPAPTADSTTDMTNVENLLRDFDTVDSQSLREPAEPFNQSAGEFQFSIPQSPGDPSAGSGGFPPSSSTAVAVYPDAPPASGVSPDGGFSIPNTSQSPNPDSAQDPAGRNGVRFTGRIQPLK